VECTPRSIQEKCLPVCRYSTALSEQHNLKPQSTADEAITEQGNDEDVTNPLQDVLSTKKVRYCLCKACVLQPLSVHSFPIHSSHTLRSQRQAVRIALKEIESLSFNMEVTGNLRNLAEDLHSLHMKCSKRPRSSPSPQNYQQCRKSSSTEDD